MVFQAKVRSQQAVWMLSGEVDALFRRSTFASSAPADVIEAEDRSGPVQALHFDFQAPHGDQAGRLSHRREGPEGDLHPVPAAPVHGEDELEAVGGIREERSCGCRAGHLVGMNPCLEAAIGRKVLGDMARADGLADRRRLPSQGVLPLFTSVGLRRHVPRQEVSAPPCRPTRSRRRARAAPENMNPATKDRVRKAHALINHSQCLYSPHHVAVMFEAEVSLPVSFLFRSR